jgi:hypothetical protein
VAESADPEHQEQPVAASLLADLPKDEAVKSVA